MKRFILAILAASVAACSPQSANAKEIPHAITVIQVAAPGDSLKYLLRWSTSTDAFGSASSYNVGVSSSKGFSLSHTIAGTVDSFTVVKPAVGDSVNFTAKVSAVRRGLVGPTAQVSWRYIHKDAPPPTPGPIVVDSSKVIGVMVRPSVVTLAVGDTARLCAFIIMGDSSIRIGVDSLAPDSVATRVYCSGVPLTQFLSERST